MNEDKPPRKKTTIKRQTKPLAQRSKKMESLYVERREFVSKILAKYPLCQACRVFAQNDGLSVFINRPSVDVHEIVRRSQGGSIVEESNVLAVCRPCHRRIGNEPALAFSLGLAKHGYEE